MGCIAGLCGEIVLLNLIMVNIMTIVFFNIVTNVNVFFNMTVVFFNMMNNSFLNFPTWLDVVFFNMLSNLVICQLKIVVWT